MSFVERRTTVLMAGYQCKSLNILGTDLCVFINDFNNKSRSIQKILGDSRLGSISSWDKNRDIRLNLSDFETGSWRNQIRPHTAQYMIREGLIQNTSLLRVCNPGRSSVEWEFLPEKVQAVSVRSTSRTGCWAFESKRGAWRVWPARKWLRKAVIVLYEFAGGGGKRSRREEDSREGEELFKLQNNVGTRINEYKLAIIRSSKTPFQRSRGGK